MIGFPDKLSQLIQNLKYRFEQYLFLDAGRLYLGMHSPIDIFVGCAIGASLLLVWFNVDCYLDTFIIGGEYGM